MKVLIFIICVIVLIIINAIWFYEGVKFGMKYSLNKTYDVFMQAVYMKLKKDNKCKEEIIKFMSDVNNLLNTTSDKIF